MVSCALARLSQGSHWQWGSRNHRRPPHRVQRAFCLPWQGKQHILKLTDSKQHEQLLILLPEETTNTQQMLATWLQAQRGDSTIWCSSLRNKALTVQWFPLTLTLPKVWGNGTQCYLSSSRGATLVMVNILVKTPGSGVNEMMEMAPFYISTKSILWCCTEAGDTVP